MVRTRPVEGKMRRQTLVTHGGLVRLRDSWQAKPMTDAREAEKALIQGDLGL